MVVEQKPVDHIPCDSRLPLWQLEGGSGSDQGESVNPDDFYHNLPMCICPDGQLIPGCFGEYGEVPPETGDALQGRASFFASDDASMDAVADNNDDGDKKKQTYHNCGEYGVCKGEKPQVVNEPKERIIYVYVDNNGRTREVQDHEGGGAGEAAGSDSVGGGGDRGGAEGPDAGDAAGPGDAADRGGADD